MSLRRKRKTKAEEPTQTRSQEPVERPPEPVFGGAVDPAADQWEDDTATSREPSVFDPTSSPEPSPPETQTHPANIGESVQITGELSGHEDITIEGTVDGKITMEECSVTISHTGTVTAEICARSVIVQGSVVGNVLATEKVEITETGSLKGDITAGRIVLAEGSRFKGNIDTGDVDTPPETKPKQKPSKPEPKAEPIPDAQPASANGNQETSDPVTTSIGELGKMF